MNSENLFVICSMSIHLILSDKVAVGSFQGLVRVYTPESGSYSPDHLLIEHQTGQPVLQLETGRFIQ